MGFANAKPINIQNIPLSFLEYAFTTIICYNVCMPLQPIKFKKALEDLISEDKSLVQTTNPLKILIVGAEVAPYASVGGFASVLGYLSRELENLGHDVRLFMPKFGSIDEEKYDLQIIRKGLKIPTSDEHNPYLVCNVKQAKQPLGVPIYFLENQEYYEKRANVYGYSDDATRWALLCRGALEFIATDEFVPDVIHTNDWHTGLLPNYIKTDYSKHKSISKIATVFTIHNINFQGMLDHRNTSELDYDDGRSQIPSMYSDRITKLNFMKRGIIYSDAVNTVSKKYSKEVLTEEYGEGLNNLLLELQGKFFGIINGLDYEEFNPATDKLLAKNYTIKNLNDRIQNKIALQEEFDLQTGADIPVFGFVGRLDFQKGIDLMVETLHVALKDNNMQFICVGGGDAGLVQQLKSLKDKYPAKVGIHTYFNPTLPRLLFSGADVILYPSRFEPCGIVQIEAMRYGAVPLVRKVGGLADTVENFNTITKKGTGLVFNEFNNFALYGQIIRALELLNFKDIWRQIQKNGIEQDFSWVSSANEYINLYDLAINFKGKSELAGSR